MRVIRPQEISLAATDIAPSSYAEWDSGTSYVPGNYVVVTTATPHREYRALQNSTGLHPATNPAYWADQGATNQYRLLDDSTSTRTTATTSFYTTAQTPGSPTHLAAFGLDGVRSVRVQITWDGSEVYDQTTAMQIQRYTASWWEFFFGTRTYQSSLVAAIGGWYQGVIKVTFAGDTGAAIGVGHLALGGEQILGVTASGVELRMTQYSTKETDEFGNILLVPRANAKVASVQLRCDDDQVDRIYRVLESLDATPAVWDLNNDITDGRDVLRIWGIADFRLLYDVPNETVCELDVQGLI